MNQEPESAFPAPAGKNHAYPTPGMTLRDYFAGIASQGWLASFAADCPHPGESEVNRRYIAVMSYAMADAMMEARKGTS